MALAISACSCSLGSVPVVRRARSGQWAPGESVGVGRGASCDTDGGTYLHDGESEAVFLARSARCADETMREQAQDDRTEGAIRTGLRSVTGAILDDFFDVPGAERKTPTTVGGKLSTGAIVGIAAAGAAAVITVVVLVMRKKRK